jgi:uncharacterized protein with von Willebrand factor type A (vWA) domain
VTEAQSTAPAPTSQGRLATNIVHFARTLRTAGLRVGPGQVLRAVEAVEAAGLRRRDDFYWTLHSVFVNRRDQRELFDQAFHVFWRNPRLLEKILSMLLPSAGDEPEPEKRTEMNRRLAEALQPATDKHAKGEDQEPPEIEIEATLTFSDRELLQKRDFEQMSQEEAQEAMRAIDRMRLSVSEMPTRRFKANRQGRRIDMRNSLRHALRNPGLIELQRKSIRRRPPPLVVLCDISGSMGRYTRMFLHFMHALTNDRDRVHCFLFGTRLSNVTRQLRNRDVDIALDKTTALVEDWSGGTRIGACLHDFNRLWARRVLGQGAVVLMITDGLDREGADGIAEEMERLHKSCARLIWLNPLLRYTEFAPKSQGIKAILPHVDEFRPVHNLESLTALAQSLSRPTGAAHRDTLRWQSGLKEVA